MAVLVHGTALVVGTTGLMLVGPSGAGKSSVALRLLSGARRDGHFAALLSDDQVFIDAVNDRLIATAPPAIKGMIELYGSGIGRIETIDQMVLHLAVQPVAADSSNRIPEKNQRWSPFEGAVLPLVCIDRVAADPFGILRALLAGFPLAGAFQI
jgi:serine kinase of HPr protein (carbohydrate metabolism regulator)